MGKFAQLVIGPAGGGKVSTYCYNVHKHCEVLNRVVHIANLDPAAEDFKYPLSFDVKDLVSLVDVMEELELGPNGALLYAMEFFENNLEEWLGEELQGFGEDDYLVFDCPGQIELYSHIDVFRTLVDWLKLQGWQICVVYCVDSQFISESTKFVAGCLQALSAMILLELPHVNIFTKVDILSDETKKTLEQFIYPDSKILLESLHQNIGKSFYKLNTAVAQLIDDWSMISFIPLDYSDEDSISFVLSQIDHAIQFGEDQEVKTRDFDDASKTLNGDD